MKKKLIIFLINLSIPIVCFSQNIYDYPKILNDSLIVITPKQLKQTNILFLERSKLLKEKAEYKKVISNYKLLTSTLEELNYNYNSIILENNNTITKLQIENQKYRAKNKRYKKWFIGTLGVSFAVFIPIILFK